MCDLHKNWRSYEKNVLLYEGYGINLELTHE